MQEKLYVTMPVYMLMIETEKGKKDVFFDTHPDGTADKMAIIFSGQTEARSCRDSFFPDSKVFKFSKESALANHLEDLSNHPGVNHVALDPSKRDEKGFANITTTPVVDFVRWLRRTEIDKSDTGVL